MLNEFLFRKIEEKDIGNLWFQQDGAMCHTAEAILDVLRSVFEDRISAAELMSFGQLRAAIDLKKMPTLAKKSSFQIKLILILAGM